MANMITLTKQQVKLFRKLRRMNPIPRRKLLRIMRQEDIELWQAQGILHCDQMPPVDKSGFAIGDVPISATYTLTDLGYATVEQYDWFDWQYVVTYIIVPIIIGVASSVICNLIFK